MPLMVSAGVVTVPVKVGDASGARELSSVLEAVMPPEESPTITSLLPAAEPLAVKYFVSVPSAAVTFAKAEFCNEIAFPPLIVIGATPV